MKVFFTAPFKGKKDYQKYYDKIIETILNTDENEVISLEVQGYEDLLDKDSIQDLEEQEIHYLYNKKAIGICDVVVIEASRNNFKIGHEATLGVIYRKPVLVVSSTKDYSLYLKDKYFTSYKYENEEELEKYVRNFLKTMKNKNLTVRFNSYISADQRNFLDWCSKRANRKVSELLRDLIDSEMKKYPEYEDDINRFLK